MKDEDDATDEELELLKRARSAQRVELAYQRARLTKREREVFSLIARGCTQQEAARKLRMTQQAVSKSLAAATTKLQALKSDK